MSNHPFSAQYVSALDATALPKIDIINAGTTFLISKV